MNLSQGTIGRHDYYPFGMGMVGRNYLNNAYSFGYNGKENEAGWDNSNSIINFEARIYDSRISRWLAIDPLWPKYACQSPYLGMNANPIIFIDPSGKGGILSNIRRVVMAGFPGNYAYQADLNFTLNIVVDPSVSTVNNVTALLNTAGINVGIPMIAGQGMVRGEVSRMTGDKVVWDFKDVAVNVMLTVNVITPDQAKGMINENVAADQNFLALTDVGGMTNAEVNIGASNVGVIELSTFRGPQLREYLTHWSWHSANARYSSDAVQMNPGGPFVNYRVGSHNVNDGSSLMQGGPIANGDILTYEDFNALAPVESQEFIQSHTHLNAGIPSIGKLTNEKGQFVQQMAFGASLMTEIPETNLNQIQQLWNMSPAARINAIQQFLTPIPDHE